jgi:glutaredoxin 3
MPPITIYTKSWCPYCSAAKKLFKQKGADFIEIDIEAKPDMRAEMIAKASGRSTVPQIFIGPQHRVSMPKVSSTNC